jgi:hypothetical protein
MSEDFVTRMDFYMCTSSTKTHVRLANGQRVSSIRVCGISFTVAQHDSVRTCHVLHDLSPADIMFGLPWLGDEQATLELCAERFVYINGWHCDREPSNRVTPRVSTHLVD